MIKISVITACYNAEEFIERTIRSVLDQDYSNLEYIIIDGASSDRTFDIVKRYERHLAVCVSEPDQGQYHAINRGMGYATGDVQCWLNADDVYLPWTLSVVAEIFASHPNIDWVTGLPAFLNRGGQLTGVYGQIAAYPRRHIVNGWYNRQLGGFLQQENMFWRRSLWEKSGGLDLGLRYAADYALWSKFARHAELVPVGVPLAAFRRLPGEQRSSVGAKEYDAEVAAVAQSLEQPSRIWLWLARRSLVARSLCRLLINRRAPAIIYDDAKDQWRKTESRRSISRVSLSTLILNHVLRRPV
jgi:Glycosyl transferase family 2